MLPFPQFFRKFRLIKIKKILVLAHNGMGDVITATPLLRSIRRSFPEAEITCIVKHPLMEKVLGGFGVVNRYLHMNTAKKSITDSIHFLRKLRGENFEISFSTTDVSIQKGALFTLLAAIPRRVGERDTQRRFTAINYNFWVPKNFSQHRVQSNLDLFRRISSDEPVLETVFWISSDDEAAAENFLSAQLNFPGNRRFVAIHAGCNISESWRRWPLDRYLEVIRFLAKKYSIPIVLLGGADEKELLKKISEPDKKLFIDAVDKFPIGVTAAIIRRASFILGNDSGLMHIAGAVHTPTVSLLAEHSPERCYPWGANNRIVQPTVFTPNQPKILGIDVSAVQEAVCKQMQETRLVD